MRLWTIHEKYLFLCMGTTPSLIDLAGGGEFIPCRALPCHLSNRSSSLVARSCEADVRSKASFIRDMVSSDLARLTSN